MFFFAFLGLAGVLWSVVDQENKGKLVWFVTSKGVWDIQGRTDLGYSEAYNAWKGVGSGGVMHWIEEGTA